MKVPSLGVSMRKFREGRQEEIKAHVDGINDEFKLNDLLWVAENLKDNSFDAIVKHKVETSHPRGAMIFTPESLIWKMIAKKPSDMRRKGAKEEAARIEEILKAIKVIEKNMDELKS